MKLVFHIMSSSCLKSGSQSGRLTRATRKMFGIWQSSWLSNLKSLKYCAQCNIWLVTVKVAGEF